MTGLQPHQSLVRFKQHEVLLVHHQTPAQTFSIARPLARTKADAAKQAEGDLIDAMEPEEYVVEVEAGWMVGAWSHGGWLDGWIISSGRSAKNPVEFR